jgi:putative transposase
VEDQTHHPAALGSDRVPQGERVNGGRPPSFDPELYRHRNTVERGFNRLKHWRGIVTRYDKYALTYLGGVTLAAIIIHHRAWSTNRP